MEHDYEEEVITADEFFGRGKKDTPDSGGNADADAETYKDLPNENIGKVVEVKKAFQIEYTAYYFAPFSGYGSIEVQPGTKFKIVDVAGDGFYYTCGALDGEFLRATEKVEKESVKPFLRAKFGHIAGFYLPTSAFDEGIVEIVDRVEPETGADSGKDEDEDAESDWDGEEEEYEEAEEEQICGYPEGYAAGEPQDTYCVIDLQAPKGSNPVSYLHDVPAGGWTDEYKTTKIVLKLVKGGEFTMGSGENEDVEQVNPPHTVRLPNDFYIGIFPVTKKQFDLVVGKESKDQLDAVSAVCPMDNVGYNDIRGYMDGFNWPEYSEVDDDSFLGYLRERYGIANIDIPTAAQWEYACKAGGTLQPLNGEDMAKIAWSEENSGGKSHPVGQLQPNAWGLYDMLGNVWEWCLDWYGYNAGDEESELVSPAGIMPDFTERPSIFPFMSSGCQYARELKGGGWTVPAAACDPSSRGSSGPSQGYDFVGFRLSITLQCEGDNDGKN